MCVCVYVCMYVCLWLLSVLPPCIVSAAMIEGKCRFVLIRVEFHAMLGQDGYLFDDLCVNQSTGISLSPYQMLQTLYKDFYHG